MKVSIAIVALFLAISVNAQWQPLFDGKTLNGWEQKAGTATYAVENGMIVGRTVLNSPNSFLAYKKTFGDFVLELEAKLEDSTANSGVQFRSQFDAKGNNGTGKIFGYQCELDPSARQWSGGIYDEGRRDWLYPMDLNKAAKAAFKIGEFNKVRIECIGNEMKTWINGVPCAYLVDTVDNNGYIALQVHGIGNNKAHVGEKIYFKDIRINTGGLKPSLFPPNIYVANNRLNNLSKFEEEAGWEQLFDGQSMKKWVGAYKNEFPKQGWKISNGILQVQTSDGKESENGGDIVTKEEYGAFDLSFDFLLTPGANSGVKYFVGLSEHNEGSAIGLEYQVLDDSLHPDAKLGANGNRTLASLYDLIPARKQTRFIRQPGEWNTGRVLVTPDNQVTHFLNGVEVLSYQRKSDAWKQLVAVSKYKVWPAFGELPKGHLLLQDHGNAVSFRNIKVRRIPANEVSMITPGQSQSMANDAASKARNSWANLDRYAKLNSDLERELNSKPRVVFMGNSITDAWINWDPEFFQGKNYIDRGISGQTTAQMLVRFRPDVIDLQPKLVVILAGTNDIAGNTGPATLEEIFGNIVSMAELARANKINVILCSVLPAFDYPWRPGKDPATKIPRLNSMIQQYASKNGILYIDYFRAMADDRNGLPENLSADGVHPNLAGYKIMEKLVEEAIVKVLSEK